MTRASFASIALSLPLVLSAVSDAAPRYKRLSRPTSPAATQRSTAELESAVRTLLSGYEPLDVEHGMAQLGPQAADVLLRLIKDSATPVLVRLRALEALGYVPTPAGQAYLRDLVAQIGTVEDDRVFTLAAALRALGAFGVGELPAVSLFLNHSSADVREAAASSLSQMKGDAALSALQQRLSVERDSGVKSTLTTAIRRIATAPHR
jgi:HEAT repeat protein